ncbi:unnamed protein product, partial [Mesorhabditis spiculigera]
MALNVGGLLALLAAFPLATGLAVARNVVLTHEDQRALLISDENFYVPVGHSAVVPCPIREKFPTVLSNAEAKLYWYLAFPGDMSAKWIDGGSTYTRFVQNTTTGSLAMRNLQPVHDGLRAECWVHVSKDDKRDDRYLVARYTIVVQNCGERDDLFRNYLNPCAYGKCEVVKPWEGINATQLVCRCLPYYTGRFCNVMVGRPWTGLLISYAYNVVWVLLFVGFLLYHNIPKKRVALETLMRKPGVDVDKVLQADPERKNPHTPPQTP